MPYEYYEEKLPQAETEAIRAIKRGLSSCEREFRVPRLDTRRLGELFTLAKLDCPLLFHAERLHFSYTDASASVAVKPAYVMRKQEYETALATVSKRLKKILAPASGLSPLEKEKYIHDWIVKNVRYDRLKKSYSHEVTGPLCHGIGVCEGMSKVFKLMCGEVGIDSIVVTGIGVPPEEATGKKSERHAWNIVIMNGVPAAVDVTFDASLSNRSGKMRYDYFNVSDEFMARDHGSVDHPVPACKGASKC